ncbi:MAG: RsmE family RNA methyltransferase, partial [Candidatus Paceibacterota bacterium]
MKIHRFIDNFDLSKKELEITGEIAHQIIKVLKLKIGEKIELSDGKGSVALAEIVKLNKNIVVVKIIAPLHQDFAEQNSTKKVNLFCAILKKENFELVVQKTTECGIDKIIPIITSRTIKTGLNLERLKKIA